jgi:RNA polymerase sigma-70 factor, ECF subfamily
MGMRIDDERQFEESFRALAGHVYAYALRRAGPEVAQEVTAETFLIAWRRRDRLPAEPLPWLYGIARRVLANERRSANRRTALAARVAAQPLQPAPHERHGVIEALARLGERDREVLLLIAWEGLSTKEAAAAMGCSNTALAVRLHRARRRLARMLAEDDAPTAPGHPVSEVSA